MVLNKIKLHATIRMISNISIPPEAGVHCGQRIPLLRENVTGGRCYYAGLYLL